MAPCPPSAGYARVIYQRVTVAPPRRGGERRDRSRPASSRSRRLLAEAEICKDDVEQILDIDAAGDAAEAAPGEPQILGAQLRQRCVQRTAQRGGGRFQRLAVPGAGQNRRRYVVNRGDPRRQRIDEP